MAAMDYDSAPLVDVEEYLRSFGGFFATIPDSLTVSVRNLRPDEAESQHAEAIQRSREQAYSAAIRAVAKVCHRQHPGT